MCYSIAIVSFLTIIVIDEQAQTQLKDDEPINKKKDIEDNNVQICDNTLTGDCDKYMNKDETADETKGFEEFRFQIIVMIL